MSPVEADLMEGALVIAPERVPAALAALVAACDIGDGQGVAALCGLGFTVECREGATGTLVVNGFRGELDGAADAAVAALAPFVDDGTALIFEDDNGARWRYVITDGEVEEQVPGSLWRTVGDRATRTGGVLAPLTITRDEAGFARWWEQAPNREDIIEILESLAAPDGDGAEHGLHSLMLAVFQDTIDAAQWLHITGLRRGVVPSYLCLDIDPAHDGEGILDGVEVVLSLHTGAPFVPLKVSVYVHRAWRVLAPESMDDPQVALAELIDTALYIVNADIAAQDRFIFEARDVLAC